MNLKDLVAQGAFVSASEPIVKQEIRWTNPNGEEIVMDLWVRRASYHTVTQAWKDAEESKDHLAARIATMICDADGAPVFTAADILGTADPERGPICDTLFFALLGAVNSANGIAPAKTNPPKISGSN